MRLLIALVLLAGCGGSQETEAVCAGLASWNAAARQGDCAGSFKNSYVESDCNAGIGACSEADLFGLRQYSKCMEALPVCSRTDPSWSDEYWACQAILTGQVNANCAGAL